VAQLFTGQMPSTEGSSKLHLFLLNRSAEKFLYIWVFSQGS